MAEWFENERFWEKLEGFLFRQFRSSEHAVREIDQVLALIGSPGHGSVLDLACGPGRHALELARRGFLVTAVDRTERYLETARAAAARHGLSVELVRQDMRSFLRPASFDLALVLYTSLGFFDEEEDDRKVLRNVHDALRAGGVLVLEMMGREPLVRSFQPRRWHYDPERDEYLLEETLVRDGWRHLENRWIWIGRSGRETFDFRLRLYSGPELEDRLGEAGFSSVHLYGSLEGTPYDETAQRLVAVAYR